MNNTILKKIILYGIICLGQTYILTIIASNNKPDCACSAKENQVAWNTRTVPLNNFGTINEKKIYKISLPSNNKFLCLFIPSTGPLKSKQIKVLLVGFELGEPIPNTISHRTQEELLDIKNSNPEAQSTIIIYRQVDNDPLWTKGFSFNNTIPLSELHELSLELEPDANILIYPTAQAQSPIKRQ